MITSQQTLNELNDFALEIYKTQAAVDLFMSRPHLQLEDRRPVDIIHQADGAKRIRELLGRMAYGSGQV